VGHAGQGTVNESDLPVIGSAVSVGATQHQAPFPLQVAMQKEKEKRYSRSSVTNK
jgi:hypothetical protein